MTRSRFWRYTWCYYTCSLPFWRERRAVTAIEYALIASIMAFSILLGVTHIGRSLRVMFSNVAPGL